MAKLSLETNPKAFAGNMWFKISIENCTVVVILIRMENWKEKNDLIIYLHTAVKALPECGEVFDYMFFFMKIMY
jgi:hypothetical protein